MSFLYSRSIHVEYERKISQLSNGIKKEKKRFLKNAVERTISMIEDEIKNYHTFPQRNLNLSKNKIRHHIRNLRLIDNGYIWVNKIIDYNGGDGYAIREVHPNIPETEGQLLSTNFKDINGNQPYAVELNGINKSGEVYFEYFFKKMGSGEIAHKMSYAKLFKPWDWVIVTGVYLDDIDALVQQEKSEMTKTIKKQYSNALTLAFFIIFAALVAIIYFERQISLLITSYENEIKSYTQRLKKKLNVINGIIDSIPASVAVINFDGEIEKTNKVWNKLGKDYGLSECSSSPDDNMGSNLCSLNKKETSQIEKACAKGLKSIVENETAEFELEYSCQYDKIKKWFLMKAVRIGVEKKIITIHTDITRTKQSEIQLEAIVNTAGEAIININQSGIIQLFNPAAEKLFAYKSQDILGKNINLLIPEIDRNKFQNYIEQFLSGENKNHLLEKNERQGLKKDGTLFPLFISIEKTMVEGEIGFTGLIHDLTETKRAYEKLRLLNEQLSKKNQILNHLSTTDQLTGLYNRRYLEIQGKDIVNRCDRYNQELSLLLIDIDHFKHVNDKYGHDIGDDVLIFISKILRANSRKTDIVGRWGGEEFMILCQSRQKDAIYFAEKLRILIMEAEHYKAGKLTASFGVTHYQPGDNLYSMTKRADNSLYEAKENGRNCCKASLVTKV